MIRLVLIFLIVFLVVRIFILAGSTRVEDRSGGEEGKGNGTRKKGVPKEIGEYVDYEEIKRKG